MQAQFQTTHSPHDYTETLEERDGYIHEDDPLRSRRSRMPAAVLIVTFLTTAALFSVLGFAVGSSLTGV